MESETAQEGTGSSVRTIVPYSLLAQDPVTGVPTEFESLDPFNNAVVETDTNIGPGGAANQTIAYNGVTTETVVNTIVTGSAGIAYTQQWVDTDVVDGNIATTGKSTGNGSYTLTRLNETPPSTAFVQRPYRSSDSGKVREQRSRDGKHGDRHRLRRCDGDRGERHGQPRYRADADDPQRDPERSAVGAAGKWAIRNRQ